jgi:predicted RNase H-like nuclease (RuvC/YqgF family)
VVLLSLLSIFLCGSVVAYIANAQNYRELYEDQKKENDVLKAKNKSIVDEYNDKQAELQKWEQELQQQITQMTSENQQLQSELAKAERQLLAAQQQDQGMQSIITSFQQTIDNLEKSRQVAQNQLDEIRSELIKNRKELNDITATLYEKIAQMEKLEADRRSYLEQKTELEEKVKALAGGVEDVNSYNGYSQPVTKRPGPAQPGMIDISSNESELIGKVTEVSASLVAISIGAADGVKKDMIFHITRGDEFICDIVITYVDENRSAGVLELARKHPRVGDIASTGL